MTAEEGGKQREREREASEWVLRCLSESIRQIVFSVKASPLLSFHQTWSLLILFYCLLLYHPSISTIQNLLILHAFFPHSAYFLAESFLRLSHIAVPLTRFSAFLPPVSIHPSTPPLLGVHPSSCFSVARAFQGLLYGCMCEEGGFFPMGPQVKTGTHCPPRDAICPRRRTCWRGALSPLLLPLTPNIHPTLCPSTRRPSLTPLYRAESPRNAPPSPPTPRPFFPLVLPPSRH